MFCRRGLSCVFLKSKKGYTRCIHKKFLKASVPRLGTQVPLSTVSYSSIYDSTSDVAAARKKLYNDVSHGVTTYTIISQHRKIWKNLNCQRLQCGTASSHLSHNRNIQTTVAHFPRRCKNTADESGVIGACDYENPVPYETVVSRLQKCSSIQDQMEELSQTLCLTSEDLKRRNELCIHVKEMLSPFFNNFKVQMYGSSANGFGFRGCDIDMSLNIIGDNRKPGRAEFTDPDVPSVHDVLEGKVSVDYVAKLAQRDKLLFIHSVFLEYYKETNEPILFCNAYVPIVRFHYGSLKCDLSFGNSVAFRNTKLLNLCRLLDERVTPLMMTIRYWAKQNELIAGGQTFNTYTISLFVLYFLQTRTPAVLPSTEYLLSISDYLNNDNMEDESYLQILEKIPPSKNKQSIVELLREFFFYYAYFDYNQVMSPLNARSLPRVKVHSLKRNFRMNTIAIQDPIKLSHNVANMVSFECCRKLFTELLMGVRLFHEGKLLSPASSNWGLLSLFEKPKKYNTALPADDPLLSLQIPYVPVSTENAEDKTNSHSEKDMKQAWFQKVSRILLNVLEYGLLFECKVEEDFERFGKPLPDQHIPAVESNHAITVDNDNSIVLKRDSSTHLEEPLFHKKPSFIINCAAHHKICLGREDVKREICSSESLLSTLEVEHSVSVELNNRKKMDEERQLIHFTCECYELDSEKDASVFIKFKPVQRTDFHPILGHFLRDYIPKSVTKILNSTKAEPPRQMNVLNNV